MNFKKVWILSGIIFSLLIPYYLYADGYTPRNTGGGSGPVSTLRITTNGTEAAPALNMCAPEEGTGLWCSPPGEINLSIQSFTMARVTGFSGAPVLAVIDNGGDNSFCIASDLSCDNTSSGLKITAGNSGAVLSSFFHAFDSDITLKATAIQIPNGAMIIGDPTNTQTGIPHIYNAQNNDTEIEMTAWHRDRQDSTNPGVGFGAQANFYLEVNPSGSEAKVGGIGLKWENAQNDQTTDRDTTLTLRNMLNGVIQNALTITSAGVSTFIGGIIATTGDFSAQVKSNGVNVANTVNSQEFSTPGSFTYTVPTGAKRIEVVMHGGAGGGASGRKGLDGTIRGGGGAGSNARLCGMWFDATALSTSQAVVVGQGGAGGTSQTSNSADGVDGSDGTASAFGTFTNVLGTSNFFACAAGKKGIKGTAAGGGAGGGTTANGIFFTTSSTSTGAGAGSNGSAAGATPTVFTLVVAPTGGGGGGGISAANAVSNGGDGGGKDLDNTWVGAPTPPPPSTAGFLFGGTAGLSAGTLAGGNGNMFLAVTTGGTGGGGGASSITTNAGRGGNGVRGGGGGGGGASKDAVGNSGAGGNGSDGWVRITAYF